MNTTHTICLDKIPQTMRELHAWVVAWHKIPIVTEMFDPSLIGGKFESIFYLKWGDAANWHKFEHVEKWINDSTKDLGWYPGFILYDNSGILTIDLDYIDPGFELKEEDEILIKRSGTYAEFSVRGRVHLYVRLTPEQKTIFLEHSNGHGILAGNKVELFIDKKICVVTGDWIEFSEREPREIPTDLFLELIAKTEYGKESKAREHGWNNRFSKYEKPKPGKKIPEGSRHNSLVTYAGHLIGKRIPLEMAKRELYEFNHTFCDPPLSADKLNVVYKAAEEFERRRKEESGEYYLTTPMDVPPEVDNIIKEATPQEVTRRAYADVHSGDQEICDLTVRAFCAGREITNEGLQPKAAGKTGVGKTAGFEAGVFILPQEFVAIGTLSNKAIFYDESISAGTVFFIDDADLSDELVSFIKSAMGRFQMESVHRTLDIKRKLIILKIPPRCTFMFTSVDDIGDEQLVNRLIPCNLYDHNNSQSEEISTFFADKDERGEPQYVITDNVRASRKLLFDIGIRRFKVKVPFAKKISWVTRDIRLQRSFMTLLKSNAVLNYKYRERVTEPDGTIVVTAIEEDFKFVYQMSRFANKSEAEGRHTPAEATVIRMMFELKPKYLQNGDDWQVTQKELVELGKDKRYNISKSQVSQALNGRKNDGSVGLIQKTPGMIVEDIAKTTFPSSNSSAKETVRGHRITVPGTLRNPDDLDSVLGVARLE